jgi:hypothetical protein
MGKVDKNAFFLQSSIFYNTVMLLYPLAQVQYAIYGHSEQNEGMICSRICLERNIKLLLQQFLYARIW